jgi:outer membrane protein TolC
MISIVAALLTVTVAQDTVRLSFPQALDRARQNNPDFVNERLDFENSIIEFASARAERYFPQLSLNFTLPQYVSRVERELDDGEIRFNRQESRTVETELELEQPLPTGGFFRLTGTLTGVGQPSAEDLNSRYAAASFLGFELEQQVFGINRSFRDWRLAREDFAQTSAEFADEERNLAQEVMEAYYALVQALKQAQIDSVMYVRDSIRNAGSGRGGRVREITSNVDSLKFLIEATRSAMNLLESDDELTEARAELNEILALPASTIVIPDADITVERLVPDVEAGLASALRNRQDLRIAELSVENREAGLKDARRTSPITLFINSQIGFDGSAEGGRPRTALSDALGNQDRSRRIDLGVSVPLFDRFEERHAVAQAQNDLRASEVNLADQRRRLENEVRNAAFSVDNASRRLELAERLARHTQQVLGIDTQRYGREEINLVEFLISQTDAREAEIGLLEAQVEMLTATEEWRRAIGERSGLGTPR